MATSHRDKVIGVLLIVLPIVLFMGILSAYAITSFVTHNLAPEVISTTGSTSVDLGQRDLRGTVGSLLNMFLGFLGIISALFIPVGVGLGVYYLVRKSGPDEVAQAKYAGFWRRFAAALLDGFIYFAGLLVVSGFFGLITFSRNVFFGIALFLYFFSIVFVWLYYSLFESSNLQATPGKLILKIKVTDMEGKPVSFGRATGRYFAKMISGLTFYVGYIMAGFTEKKQALHDIIAECLVVKK